MPVQRLRTAFVAMAICISLIVTSCAQPNSQAPDAASEPVRNADALKSPLPGRHACTDAWTWMECVFSQTGLNPDTRQLERMANFARIGQIAIPGTHDSGANNRMGIGSKFIDQCTGAPPWTSYAAKVVLNWAKTQNQPVSNQISDGSRYFDLRLIYGQVDAGFLKEEWITCHGKTGESVIDIVGSLESYSRSHPKEINIVNVQKLYEDKSKMQLLANTLRKLCSAAPTESDVKDLTGSPHPANLTVSQMWEHKWSTILTVDDPLVAQLREMGVACAFPASEVTQNFDTRNDANPFANSLQDAADHLIDWLVEEASSADGKFRVTQFIWNTQEGNTPHDEYYFQMVTRSLQGFTEALGGGNRVRLIGLLQQRKIAETNIVITDFLGHDEAFWREVAALNFLKFPMGASTPRDVTITPGEGKVDLTWESPAEEGKLGPITGYTVSGLVTYPSTKVTKCKDLACPISQSVGPDARSMSVKIDPSASDYDLLLFAQTGGTRGVGHYIGLQGPDAPKEVEIHQSPEHPEEGQPVVAKMKWSPSENAAQANLNGYIVTGTYTAPWCPVKLSAEKARKLGARPLPPRSSLQFCQFPETTVNSDTTELTFNLTTHGSEYVLSVHGVSPLLAGQNSEVVRLAANVPKPPHLVAKPDCYAVQNANCRGAGTTNREFVGTMSGSDMRNSDFQGARIPFKEIEGSNFGGSDFRNAQFTAPSGVFLANTDFTGVDFSGADLTGLEWLASRAVIMKDLKFSKETRCYGRGTPVGPVERNGQWICQRIGSTAYNPK